MPDLPPSAPDEASLFRSYRELQTVGSGECPHPDALTALALGETALGERDALADHIVACRRCSESYQILARTHREVAASRSTRRPWIAAAAMVVLATGAIVVWRSGRREEAFRGTGRSAAESVAPADGATLSAVPTVLRWPAQRQAEDYRVKLFAADGDALWQADVQTSTQVTLPKSAQSRLQSGKSYFWTVEVRLPLDTQRLGPFSFRLQ